MRHRARLTFSNLERQTEALRALYHALTGAQLRLKVDKYPLQRFEGEDGDSLTIELESGNYGLGFTLTRFALSVRGSSIATEDRDFDNCAPEGGVFEVDAKTAEARERIVAALAAWHAENGVTTFTRVDS